MVLGDPYKFSIVVSEVAEWNAGDSSFHNGILLFCIAGMLYPQEIETVTLGYEIDQLKRVLAKPTINEKIYNMDKEEAYVEMYNTTYPPDYKDNDYRYYISPQIFSDRNYCVFMVSNGHDVRIMAAKLEYIIDKSRHKLKDIDIHETFISEEELHEMVSRLEL